MGFIFLGIVFLAIFISIQYKVAKMFEKIAVDKGYSEDAHVFAMCFWLGLIGYIYVASMPKLGVDRIEAQKERTEQSKKIDIKSNEDFEKTDKIYQEATQKMIKGNESNSVEFYKEALVLFNRILSYKNTDKLVVYCERKIQELENKN